MMMISGLRRLGTQPAGKSVFGNMSALCLKRNSLLDGQTKSFLGFASSPSSPSSFRPSSVLVSSGSLPLERTEKPNTQSFGLPPCSHFHSTAKTMSEDYYKILGVPKTATQKEIKNAFRDLARQHHPDQVTDPKQKEEATKRFAKITGAYEILGNEEKRQMYDQYGPDAFSGDGGGGNPFEGGMPDLEEILRSFNSRGGGGGGFGGFGGFEEIFSSFMGGDEFGGRSGRSKKKGKKNKRRNRRDEDEDDDDDFFVPIDFGRNQKETKPPADVKVAHQIDFEQAVNGGQSEIKFTADIKCSSCNGSGEAAGSKSKNCNRCGGKGRMVINQGIGQMIMSCPSCGGKGTIITDPCKPCSGSGVKRTQRSVTIDIPPGVEDGVTIRVPGQGHSNSKGKLGHLYLNLKVKPHQYFRREGNNISVDVPITMSQAILGTTVTIPTFNGDAEVRIPPGSQPNEKIVIRGKGVRKQGQHGNLIAVLKVQVPTRLSANQTELLEQFAADETKPQLPWQK
eukprot:TRINITY_DN1345_c0_g1_i1.p1 TRINITY_DN1345_c0_g1~~TRINITY_DN1345_c0_g1_i1.p1  ORF type:complete len:509 (-),score=181.93 TRINITY_DN1345_c0_g1_i1:55-1581(-)